MGTPHRQLFRRVFHAFGLGGAVWNESRSAQPKNESKLSGIIMEINDLREFALGPNRPKQDRQRFLSFAACR
jgi:hypothetical protein